MNALVRFAVAEPTQLVAWRIDPVRGDWQYEALPTGLTLAEMAARLPIEPDLLALMDAQIDDYLVPRAWWRYVRPKIASGDRPVFVSFSLSLHGKNSGRIFSAVAAVALIVASIATGQIEGAGLGLQLLTAALRVGGTILGSLALQGLSKPADQSSDTTKDIGFAAVQNDFEPSAGFPLVMGTAKIAPPIVVPAFTSIDGDDQFATVVLGMPGRHLIGTIYNGDVDIGTAQGVEIETRSGDPGDIDLTLVVDTRIEEAIGLKMSEWETDPEDLEALEDTDIFGTVEQAEPLWHPVETKKNPKSFRVEFLCPAGLAYTLSDSTIAFAIRGRFRRKEGDAWGGWVNLPEIIARGKRQGAAVRLHLWFDWVAAYPDDGTNGNPWPPSLKEYSSITGWAQLLEEDVWSSPFVSGFNGSGGHAGWSYVSDKEIRLRLLTGTYPRGRYQFEFKRSWAFLWSDWDPDTFTLDHPDGDTEHLFDVLPDGVQIPYNPSHFIDDVNIQSVQNVWPEYPIEPGGGTYTYIAARVKNQSLDTIKVVLSRKIADWNGSAWVDGQVTSSPASLYRDALIGPHNARPVPVALINMAGLQDWHEWCVAADKVCDMVVKDASVEETLKKIALCGHASPIRAPLHDVAIDRPREEGPRGLITQRNAGSFSFEKPFNELPHALRVSFIDASEEWEMREITVYALGYNANGSGGLTAATIFQAITYEGITAESAVINRAELDLGWMYFRNRILHCTQPIEYLEHRRGRRVLVETDIVGVKDGRGRIKAIELDGDSLVTSLLLDEYAEFGAAAEDLWVVVDLVAVADLYDLGDQAGVEIRLADGSVLTKPLGAIDADPTRVVFETPFAMPTGGAGALIREGALVMTGALGNVGRDMIVLDVRPGRNRTAQISLVDYAEAGVYASNLPVDYELITHNGEAVYHGGQLIYAAGAP